MIGPMDPDSLDPAVLREQALWCERWAAQKRDRAEIIELSVFTAMLNAHDGSGQRGVDRLLALDPMAGLALLRQFYARVAALALQITARDSDG